MTYEEKVKVIDNRENKHAVAKAIADSILVKYGLVNYNVELDNWLFDNIMQSSLAEMLTNNQDIYIINLAKKCIADMYFIRESHNISEDKVFKMMPTIENFCNNVVKEYNLNIEEVSNEIYEDISTFGYEDTLILNDTMFIYEDNVGEERALHPFRVHIRVGYHPNYSQKELEQRIGKRLIYHRDPNDICVTFLSDAIDDNGDFHFILRISDVLDKDEFERAIRFRLGATSGKPWYRCHIVGIS